MSVFKYIVNKSLINSLEKEIGENIIIFGADSISYFAMLTDICQRRFAMLAAANIAASGFVEILTPSGLVDEPSYTTVDLYDMVAYGRLLVDDPFVLEPIDEEGPGERSCRLDEQAENATDYLERKEKNGIIRCLHKNIGRQVSITTSGGFLFYGTLVKACLELTLLSSCIVLAPGMEESTIDNIGEIMVNNCVITSVSV